MRDAIIGLAMDRSGSMGFGDSWTEAVSGFDAFVKEQAQEGNAWLTLVAFDDRQEIPYRAWNCRDIPAFAKGAKTKDVSPRGATRLYDAVGTAVAEVEDWLEENPWFDGVKTIVVITDGGENASVDYNWARISTLIDSKKEEGWEFLFLGSEMNAVADASNLGFQAQAYDPSDTRFAYTASSQHVTRSRLSGSSSGRLDLSTTK